MLFLAGKGDITVQYLEVTDRDPFLIEGIRHTGEQTKGACLVPKRALKVMEAEVNRVLQVSISKFFKFNSFKILRELFLNTKIFFGDIIKVL